MNGKADKVITETAARLRAEGTPHAVATVVRTIASTAAKPGMKAIILEDGAYAEGWLGGGCVTSAVRRAAQTAISTGEATLVCLRPEELLADPEGGADMVTLARNGCPSKGSMDIFVEPLYASRVDRVRPWPGRSGSVAYCARLWFHADGVRRCGP